MIRKASIIVVLAFGLAACVKSTEMGPNAPTAEFAALEVSAVSKLQCAWENQARCQHMVENRAIFGRIFSPEGFGNLDANKKIKGRRVTTKFIVEATAGINQCRQVQQESIPLVKDVRIQDRGYRVEGTAPLSNSSSCFLIPDPENP